MRGDGARGTGRRVIDFRDFACLTLVAHQRLWSAGEASSSARLAPIRSRTCLEESRLAHIALVRSLFGGVGPALAQVACDGAGRGSIHTEFATFTFTAVGVGRIRAWVASRAVLAGGAVRVGARGTPGAGAGAREGVEAANGTVGTRRGTQGRRNFTARAGIARGLVDLIVGLADGAPTK